MIAELVLSSLLTPLCCTPLNIEDRKLRDPIAISCVKSIKTEDCNGILLNNRENYLSISLNDITDAILNGFDNVINREKVKSYFISHDNLLNLVREAQVKIKEFFPENILVKAEVFEFMDESKGDKLLITMQSKDDLYNYLEKFEEEWWLDKLTETTNNLSFMI